MACKPLVPQRAFAHTILYLVVALKSFSPFFLVFRMPKRATISHYSYYIRKNDKNISLDRQRQKQQQQQQQLQQQQ